MKPDFDYTDDGLFVSLYPNGKQAEDALARFMKMNDGSNKILSMQFSDFRAKLKRSGWTIQKAKKVVVDDNELLKQLLDK